MKGKFFWLSYICIGLLSVGYCFAASEVIQNNVTQPPQVNQVLVTNDVVGIRPNLPFRLQGKNGIAIFARSDIEVLHQAVITVNSDGTVIMTIQYPAADGIWMDSVVYELKRKDSPTPNPNPNPNPTPNPNPNPLPPSVLWAVVVEETADQTPEQALVINSTKLRSLFPEDHFKVVDPLVNGVRVPVSSDLTPFVDRAMLLKDKWPMLFLSSPTGDVYYEGPVPNTEVEFESLVAKYMKGGA